MSENSQKEPKEEKNKKVTIEAKKLEDYELRIEEAEDLAKRMKADLENFRKTVDREKENLGKYACSNLIEKLLPVLDTFDQAMINTKSEEEKKGLGLVYSQLLEVLSKEGLKPIDAVGKSFDPYLHEIIMREPSSKEDDLILDEFQKGYMMNDRVLRHSKVKVAQNTSNNKDGDNCAEQ